MSKKANLKSVLRSAKNFLPDDEDFLFSLRQELADRIKLNPAFEDSRFSKKDFLVFRLKARPAAALATLLLVALGGGTVWASQTSLPGEILYPVKILSEQAQVALAISPQSQAEIRLDLAQKRVQEIRQVFDRAQGGQNNQEPPQAWQQALENFNQQAQAIVEQTSRLQNQGQLEQANEINNQLKATVKISEKIMAGVSQKQHEKLTQDIERVQSVMTQIGQKVDKKQTEIDQQEQRRFQTPDRSAQNKIVTAENEIAQVQKFIDLKEKKAGTSTLSAAIDKLQEAGTTLELAKVYASQQNFDQAFAKAKEAFSSAIEAKTLAQLNERQKTKDFFKIDFQNKDEKNLTTTFPTFSTSSPSKIGTSTPGWFGDFRRFQNEKMNQIKGYFRGRKAN